MGVDAGQRLSIAAETSLPGRDTEFDLLHAQLQAVQHRAQCRVVLVEGEPGIGKTRLIEHALGACDLEGARVLWGKGEELERDRPFGLVADCLGLHPLSDDPDRARIGRLLTGDDVDRSHPDRVEPRFRFVLLEAILDLIERWGSESPLVLAFDDLHWADPSSLLVLNRLDRTDGVVAGRGHRQPAIHTQVG